MNLRYRYYRLSYKIWTKIRYGIYKDALCVPDFIQRKRLHAIEGIRFHRQKKEAED